MQLRNILPKSEIDFSEVSLVISIRVNRKIILSSIKYFQSIEKFSFSSANKDKNISGFMTQAGLTFSATSNLIITDTSRSRSLHRSDKRRGR